MKKNKILPSLMIIISIIICVPSIIYLINHQTVDNFDSYYTYTLRGYRGGTIGILEGIIVIGLLLIFSVLYLLLIKKEKQIFRNYKQIILFIAVISLLFTLTLPFLSSDIYYYIGDSWLASKYGENPYYTTVKDLQDNGINDEILDNTGYWSNTTSVYGPLWNSIAKVLVSLSLGNVTIALFIFKLVSLLIHVLNSYLIYKITKSKKYMLLYGLNPLVLIELLSNVHNDIYLILFILLALYFMIRKKSICFTVLFLALSITIKYSTVLIVPFILIYCFKNQPIPKRILYCILTGLTIIALVVLFYLPYFRDFSIFTNMLVQGSKYSQSLMLWLLEKADRNIFLNLEQLLIPVFLIVYITVLAIVLFKKKIQMAELIQKYNFVIVLFIFVVLTTFQKWYILWLLPTIIWQSKNMRKFIIYLTITAIIPSLDYFMVGGDPYTLGIGYSLKILMMSSVLLIIDVLISKYLYSKRIKEKKCHV